jgi:hypothetical protein
MLKRRGRNREQLMTVDATDEVRAGRWGCYSSQDGAYAMMVLALRVPDERHAPALNN